MNLNDIPNTSRTIRHAQIAKKIAGTMGKNCAVITKWWEAKAMDAVMIAIFVGMSLRKFSQIEIQTPCSCG